MMYDIRCTYEVNLIRFGFIIAASMKMRVFWYIDPCSLVEVDRHFRCAYYLHHQGDKHTLMMEAVNTSETLVRFYETTRSSIPEDCH
jgi:hypothetical protein